MFWTNVGIGLGFLLVLYFIPLLFRKKPKGSPVCYVDMYGNKYWILNGLRHREDGPAVEFADGTRMWYQNGEPHREDGPAVEWENGSKFYYFRGRFHRVGGPAIEMISGEKRWYEHGSPHREDGPAIEYPCGYREFWIKGRHKNIEEMPDEFWKKVNEWKLIPATEE